MTSPASQQIKQTIPHNESGIVSSPSASFAGGMIEMTAMRWRNSFIPCRAVSSLSFPPVIFQRNLLAFEHPMRSIISLTMHRLKCRVKGGEGSPDCRNCSGKQGSSGLFKTLVVRPSGLEVHDSVTDTRSAFKLCGIRPWIEMVVTSPSVYLGSKCQCYVGYF